MKRMMSLLFLIAATGAAACCSATVLYLEPFNLKLGVSTESEVLSRLGSPQQRVISPGKNLDLRFKSNEPDIRSIQVGLVPDTDGAMRVEQVHIRYRIPRPTQTVQDQFHLSAPARRGTGMFDGERCRVEYHEKAFISSLQSVSLGLVSCGSRKKIDILSYLSPDAFRRLAMPSNRHAAQRNGLSAFAFDRLAQAAIHQTPGVGPFVPDDVVAVKLIITTLNPNDNDDSEREFVLWRNESGFESRQGAVDTAIVATLGRLSEGATSVVGAQGCDSDGDRVSAEVVAELHLLIDGRRPLRIRSNPYCGDMLPWSVTDGEHLSVLMRPDAGDAIAALADKLCAQCFPHPQARSSVSVNSAKAANFSALYKTLLSEWRRLGKDHGATEIQLQTQALADALDWMNHERFERELRKTAAAGNSVQNALARDLLRILHVARWAYIDRHDNLVLAHRFDKAGRFSAGSALVSINGISQLIDRQGRPVAQAWTGEPAYSESLFQPAQDNGKWGFADQTGNMVVSASFDAVEPFAEDLAAVQSGGKWGFIDPKGRWVIAPQFSAVRRFSEGLAAARLDSLWGYIDQRGRFVISPHYIEAGDFGEGLAPIR